MSIVDQLHWIVTSYAGVSFFPFSVTTFSWVLPCDVATDFYLYSLQFWMNTVLRISLDSQWVIWFIPYSYKCPFMLEALFVLIFRKTNFGTNGDESAKSSGIILTLFVLIFSCTKSKWFHERCSNCPRHSFFLVYSDSLGLIFNSQRCFCLSCEATRMARNFAPHIPLIHISLKMHRFWGKQRIQ